MSARTRARIREPRVIGCLTAILAGLAALLPASAHGSPVSVLSRSLSRPLSQPAQRLATAQLADSTSTSTPPAPTGDPRAVITAPTDGTTVSTGTAVSFTATLSADLVTALQATGTSSCYFGVGDDANSAAAGTIDLGAGTCTGRWTYAYAGTYSVSAWVNTPAAITYTASPITLTVTGGADPRCTGQASAPASCSYHWAEVYYTSPANTRYGRVCDIDGGCIWQTTHTSWPQIPGSDYWRNSTGQTLPDGNAAEAYLCLGSSPADWSSYTSSHDFTALLAQPETSAAPTPTGTC